MNAKRIHKLLFTALVIVVLVAAFGWINSSSKPANADNVLTLKPPSFVGSARAAEITAPSDASFLENEAGIAAYTQTAFAIDLSIVRDVFRTIERETAHYIVGSVGIPDLSADHDPHVYVHADGWVVAYYLVADPASAAIDLRHYDGATLNTTLENAMEQILTVIGAVPFTASYYDFRYPNATNLMLIAEANYEKTDEFFEVMLPANFTYYERSWAHALMEEYYYDNSSLSIDDTEISQLSSSSTPTIWAFAHEFLTPAQLPPGAFHTVSLQADASGYPESPDAFGGLALVYQEVP